MVNSNAFGEYFKSKRLALKLTLRAFAAKNALDAGNLSRLERGVVAIPAGHKILERYADALGIKRDSEDWFEFFDLAAAQSGSRPIDIDEAELVRHLPVFFRTLRGQPVPDDKLDALVELIRRSESRGHVEQSRNLES